MHSALSNNCNLLWPCLPSSLDRESSIGTSKAAIHRSIGYPSLLSSSKRLSLSGCTVSWSHPLLRHSTYPPKFDTSNYLSFFAAFSIPYIQGFWVWNRLGISLASLIHMKYMIWSTSIAILSSAESVAIQHQTGLSLANQNMIDLVGCEVIIGVSRCQVDWYILKASNANEEVIPRYEV